MTFPFYLTVPFFFFFSFHETIPFLALLLILISLGLKSLFVLAVSPTGVLGTRHNILLQFFFPVVSLEHTSLFILPLGSSWGRGIFRTSGIGKSYLFGRRMRV